MSDFLINHAQQNVWCSPNQDLQSRTVPKRLTPANGAFNEVTVMWRTHRLPIQGKRFHVYQIGQLDPRLMGLFPSWGRWTSLSEACGKEKMIVDLYFQNGLQLARSFSWFMVTKDKNLIIAILDQPLVGDLGRDTLFVRVYSNAYFHSIRSNDDVIGVKVNGIQAGSTVDLLAFQREFEALRTEPGVVYGFVNGYKVPAINLLTAKVGDVVEYVYDSSIYKVVEYPILALPVFESTLDTKLKYLLHYLGDDHGTIDYHDDVDFWVSRPGVGRDARAVYYHRNAEDSVRQLTHRDYSLVTQYVARYPEQQQWDPMACVITAHLRKAGWSRTLIDENNRVKELYKLPDAEIVQAMVGVNSVVENWRAATLEASAYVKLMGVEARDITETLVEEAYGYNAVSKLLDDTPRFVRDANGQPIVDVPYGLQQYSTAYEYDAQGRLLNWHTHLLGTVYPARSDYARLIEQIPALVGDRLDETRDQLTQTLESQNTYRFYTCPKVNGIPTYQYTDVTDSNLYVVINNQLTWFVDLNTTSTLVRSDAIVLGYSFTLAAQDGLLKFSLTNRILVGSDYVTQVLKVPLGELDLFLNDRPIIEGIDYHVNFPEIVIINKEYQVQPLLKPQKITVRFSGFCDSQFQRLVPKDIGFVNYGQLSRNNRFDIRDDKVMRYVVGGALYDRSQLKFVEDNPGVYPQDAQNGQPYLIRDMVTPLRGNTTEETYAYRAKSVVIDERVSNYLTTRLPQPVPQDPSASKQLYRVYSPFFTKIMFDLINKWLWDDRLWDHYSDQVVKELCQPYEYLLYYDPTQLPNQWPETAVIVDPHPLTTVVSLDIYYYKFLARVNRLYLFNQVDLSNHLNITNG